MKFEITNNETRNIITLNETTELSEFHQNEQGVPPPAQSASSSNNSSHDSNERLSPTHYEPSSSTATLPSPPSPSTSPSAAITESQRRRLESFTLYTPKNILLLFTLVNLVVYFDRGVPGSAIPYIRVDNDITGGAGKPPLTQTECGTLYSAFMFGFFIFNPICVALGGYFSSNRIILAGISAWCVAVICAGAAQSFTQLLVARAFTGIGESAYIAFSVTVLDDIAPPARRSLWLSIFYCTIPFGNAMGIAVNSLIASRSYGEGGTIAGWRMGFFLEAIPMAILVAFVTFLPNEYNVRVEDRGRVDWVDETNNNNNNTESNGQQELHQNNSNEKHMNLPRAVYCLLTNENWVIFCSGYIVYTASLGALSFFAVSMLVQSNFDVTAIQASLLLGIATSAMGFVGSILGGKILDSLPGGSIGVPGLRNAASIMTASMVLAIPCGFIALNASAFTTFCVFFIPAVFCAFVVTAPMASSILSVVPSNLRPYSVAVNTLAIHLLGDLESPWITGKLADAFDGGCNAFDSNRTLCEKHSVAGGSCKFMTGSSSNEKTSCVNPDELFQAMRIVWLFMLLTLPSWGYLSWKFRNELIGVAAEEEETNKRALEK